MSALIEVTGSVQVGRSAVLSKNIIFGKALSITGNIIIGTDRNYERYDGDYVVTPKSYEQILETDELLMSDDVTVEEIPYKETTNVYGGLTINIGG